MPADGFDVVDGFDVADAFIEHAEPYEEEMEMMTSLGLDLFRQVTLVRVDYKHDCSSY